VVGHLAVVLVEEMVEAASVAIWEVMDGLGVAGRSHLGVRVEAAALVVVLKAVLRAVAPLAEVSKAVDQREVDFEVVQVEVAEAAVVV